jgi:hypothetical protein
MRTRKQKIPSIELDVEMEIRGTVLDLSVSVDDITVDDDSYNDEFGTVECGYSLSGYSVVDIKAYSKRLQRYISVSPKLQKEIADTIEDEEEYSDMIWEQVCIASQPDPDTERDNYYGN